MYVCITWNPGEPQHQVPDAHGREGRRPEPHVGLRELFARADVAAQLGCRLLEHRGPARPVAGLRRPRAALHGGVGGGREVQPRLLQQRRVEAGWEVQGRPPDAFHAAGPGLPLAGAGRRLRRAAARRGRAARGRGAGAAGGAPGGG